MFVFHHYQHRVIIAAIASAGAGCTAPQTTTSPDYVQMTKALEALPDYNDAQELQDLQDAAQPKYDCWVTANGDSVCLNK